MRIAVGSSLAWTEELSRYSFLWAVYVGAALAVKRGGHVRITAQFMFLSTRWRLVLRAVGDIIWDRASPFDVAWYRARLHPKRACITPKCRLPSAL